MLHKEYPSLLTLEQFSDLPTPRKLAYYKKHRHLRWLGTCDWDYEIYREETKEISKMYEDASKYIDDLQDILNKCEHVE